MAIDYSHGWSGAWQGLQQQAFENNQVATRNDILNKQAQVDTQQRQLKLQNEQNTQALWQKLQNGGAPSLQESTDTQLKTLAQTSQQDDKQISMLRDMAKVAPTPEKAIAYSKAADEAEKKSADTIKQQLDTVQKRLSIGAGIATGALQVDSQQGWDYYRAQAMQNGVPLPKTMTGEWGHDKPIVEAISHQIDRQKDILAAKAEQVRLDLAAQRQRETQNYHTQSLALRRSDEALKRERLSFEKTKAGTTKDPKVAMQKELNTIHNQYMNQYQRLIKERDKSSTESGKTVVNERIQKLNELYGQQKRDVANSFGVPIPGAKETGPVKSASDFMAKYGLQ